ncbi:hypothetical protein NM688_g7159 [Phlebia brevispora]|uniref:Uncharacterized protein n=1 Tax=Phlebia brevispora TaxID=194682 RepID=A0ACC1S8K3_9APHY|nr:hypothetical protein NM688_g7159 [Phlebia brevispora]
MSLERLVMPPEEHVVGAVHPYPSLPTELVLQILVAACTLSHDVALQVSCVSKWVRHACIPYVFSTIIRRAGSIAGWGTNGMLPRHERGISHLLPPPGCGAFVRNLWIESIDMLSSPGELSIFVACPNLEDVAMTAKSLRALYSSITYKTKKPSAQGTNPASRIRSLTLLEHTYRYDWHFLVDVEVEAGHAFLHNITHLRLLTMQQSAYIPIEHLPNLTHLGLPYLHLRTNRAGDSLRLPDGILEREAMQMVVLTVDEREWLYKPWHLRITPPSPDVVNSPRRRFQFVMQKAIEKDTRLHLVLAPTLGQGQCEEWTASARGGETVWEKALRVGRDESSANVLPETFPSTDLKYTTPMLPIPSASLSASALRYG